MKRVTLDQLPVDDMHRAAVLDTAGIDGVAIVGSADLPRATAWGPACVLKSLPEVIDAYGDPTEVWERDYVVPAARTGTRTARALALLAAHPSMKPFKAAKSVGLAPSVVYRALARQQERAGCAACVTCGRPL